MSIIDPKYKDKYKQNKDWLSKAIEQHAYEQKTKERSKTEKVEGEPDKVTSEIVNVGKPAVNLNKLFDVAEANGIKARELYGAQIDRPGAPGRLRMTIGNSLRAAAKARHGLNLPVGEGGAYQFVDADAAFIGDLPKTQNPDGSKIAKAKPAETEGEAPETTATGEGEAPETVEA